MNNSTVNMTNNSEIEQHNLVSYNLWPFIILMIVSSITLSSSIFSLCFLHTYLKKLHHILKLILSVLCGYNLICCTVNAIILIYFRFKREQTLLLCGFIQITTMIPIKLSFDTLCIISVVRYYMTWKTTKLESIKKQQILISVGAVYVVEHLIILFLFINGQMDIPIFMTLVGACAGKHKLPSKMTAIGIFHILNLIMTCGIGVYFDLKLYKLLKKRRNQIGPGQVQLVPWKTGNNSSEDIMVPIKATIVSILVPTILIGWFRIIALNKLNWSWMERIIGPLAIIALLMPVLLGQFHAWCKIRRYG